MLYIQRYKPQFLKCIFTSIYRNAYIEDKMEINKKFPNNNKVADMFGRLKKGY